MGIRIKPLNARHLARAARSLDLFVATLVRETGGRIPPGFVVTLPKVVLAEQVTALVHLFETLEADLGIPDGILRLELMIETPQSLIAPDGRVALPALVDAAEGRCVAAHFGVYDHTASLQITAAHQTLDHPQTTGVRVGQLALDFAPPPGDPHIELYGARRNPIPTREQITHRPPLSAYRPSLELNQ